MARSTTASRKVLVPLATMLAAGAIAVGSGASFTSTSQNSSSSVTSGTLTQSNSKDGQAIFSLTNIKPGDTVNGKLTITNTGSLPARFSLTETVSSNQFASPYLKLTITNQTTGALVWGGNFGDIVDGTPIDLAVWQPAAANTYVFSAYLDPSAPNSEQNKKAAATFKWDSVQLDGTVTEQ